MGGVVSSILLDAGREHSGAGRALGRTFTLGKWSSERYTRNRFCQFPDFTNGQSHFLHCIHCYNRSFSPWREAERFLQMFSLQQMEQKRRSVTRKIDRCVTFATIKIQQRLKAVAVKQKWKPRVSLNLFLIKSEGEFQSSISTPRSMFMGLGWVSDGLRFMWVRVVAWRKALRGGNCEDKHGGGKSHAQENLGSNPASGAVWQQENYIAVSVYRVICKTGKKGLPLRLLAGSGWNNGSGTQEKSSPGFYSPCTCQRDHKGASCYLKFLNHKHPWHSPRFAPSSFKARFNI